jgi:hypothetical protein
MKKLSFVFTLLFAASTLFMISCADDDTTAPVITVLGDNPVDHLLNTDYIDAGATAQDDEDGDLTVEVENNVNPDKIGTYNVNYFATDLSGNTGSATRTVNIIVKQVSFQFTWSVVDSVVGVGQGIYDYNSAISSSATDPGKILISNFGGFGNQVIVTANFDKFGNITIPSQQMVGVDPGSEGTVSGTGSMADHGNNLFIEYTITYDAGGTDTGYATFTKL